MSVTILTGFDKAKWFYDSFSAPFIHYSSITPFLGFVSIRLWKLADRLLISFSSSLLFCRILFLDARQNADWWSQLF